MQQQRPLPLVLLPPTCQLHRLARRVLNRHHTAHPVAHSASGVAGLQGVLAAGLGLGCRNQSALIPELAPLAPRHGLPALPQSEFRLLPQVREMLAARLP